MNASRTSVAAGPVDVEEYLRTVVENDASDLHLKVGEPPVIRVDGALRRTEFPVLTESDTERLTAELMTEKARREFAENGEADFAYNSEHTGRFRCNVYRQRGKVGAALRRVFAGSANFEELHLPHAVQRLAEEHRGLILVTGMTGSGKTATTGAMIDYINRSRASHIITIEDPIEILHTDAMSLVNQREIGLDTSDFLQALKRAMRQDPDVIFIGEVRDEETAKAAITAAETGHLVISTLHTIDAQETITRIIELFPPHQQNQIRISLAGSLRGIISQRLLVRSDGHGRVPAVEVLVMNGRLHDMITDPEETHGIYDVIAESGYYGMQTFEQSLLGLLQSGYVTLEECLATSQRPHDFQIMARQAGLEV
ncbi:MAG: type IV pilus twitching motility protein PilT [Actinomycetota bacterium]